MPEFMWEVVHTIRALIISYIIHELQCGAGMAIAMLVNATRPFILVVNKYT